MRLENRKKRSGRKRTARRETTRGEREIEEAGEVADVSERVNHIVR